MLNIRGSCTKTEYSRTIETTPDNAQLLDHLTNRYVMPVMRRKIPQGSMTTGRKKLSQQKELEAILNFGTSKPVQQISRQPAGSSNIAQDSAPTSMSQKELENVERLLEFASSKWRN